MRIETYQTLESMKGSVWLCENCEETFSEWKVRIDKLTGENVELKARIRDLEELPNIVQSLRFQVESLSKDLEFLLSGMSGSNTQVIEKRAAPPLRLSNRFEILNQVDQLTAPNEHDEAQGSIPNVATPPSASSATPAPPICMTQIQQEAKMPAKSTTPSNTTVTACSNSNTSIFPLANNSNHKPDGVDATPLSQASSSDPPSSKFFIRGVLKSTTLEAVKTRLTSYGIPQEQVNTLVQPASLIPSTVRKFLEISLTTPMANNLHEALKAERSLGWFISIFPQG